MACTAVMRLREQLCAMLSQPETDRWVIKDSLVFRRQVSGWCLRATCSSPYRPLAGRVSLHVLPVNSPSATASDGAGVPWTPAPAHPPYGN